MKNLKYIILTTLFFIWGQMIISQDVPAAERQALIDLYNATDGPNWTNSTNWNTSALVSDWFGVTVVDGKVTQIKLGDNALIGVIPATLTNLIHLEVLELFRNGLSGTIPSNLNLVSGLRILRFELNQLTGTIPPEIGQLTDLTYLHFGFNNLTGSIPPEIGQLENVGLFSIKSNQINGNIPTELNGMLKMTDLNLSNNNLTGSIPGELGILPVLRYIDFGSNDLSGSIPVELGNLNTLGFFNIGGNQISGTIPLELMNATNLSFVNLNSNKLTGQIPTEIANLNKLEWLDLSGNQLSGSIPDDVINIPTLERFIVSNNLLSDNIPIFTSISSLSHLKYGGNQFVYSNFEAEHSSYVSSFTTNYTFSPQAKVDQEETLSVAENGTITLTSTVLTSPNNSYQWFKDGVAIAGATTKDYVISSATPADAGVYYFEATNSIVTGLTLTRNNITLTIDPPVDTCGVSEAEKQALLDLYNSTNGDNWTNTLAGDQPWDINTPVCDWYGVTVVDGKVIAVNLGNNNLSGGIPLSISDLIDLIVLSLDFNNLTGSIPTTLGSLTKLQTLSCRVNSISGTIPSELGNIQSLQNLVFTDNVLTGVIPTELESLTNLKSLELRGNNLTGTIPIGLGNLPALTIMNLSKNQLTGNIPAQFGNLNFLQNLSLDENQLTGIIPLELGNIGGSLTNLSIRDNQLTGGIPIELGSLTNLLFFNFNNNQLSGSIPSELGGLITLRQIAGNDNNLSGELPPELGNLNELEVLNLNGNQFSGSIPSSYATMSSLQDLFLNNNKLSGSIPSLISLPNFDVFSFVNNDFVFSNFETEHSSYVTNLTNYSFAPQAKVDQEETLSVAENGTITLTSTALTSPNNSYQWFKDGVAIAGATTKDYVISSAVTADAGVYYFEATNSIVTGLTLTRNNITLSIDPPVDTCGVSETEKQALLDLYNSTDGDNWTNTLAGNQPWDTNIPVCDWFGVTVVNGNVTKVVLNNNRLSGNLKVSIGNLSNLLELNLFGNQLSGTLPTEISNLNNLRFLFLQGNSLTGSIPSAYGSLSNLIQLNIGTNDLSGVMPPELGNLTNLTYLRLDNNQLTGSLPNEIGNLGDLQTLFLTNNQLTGPIPAEIGNLSNLEFLILIRNQFSGNIPSELGNLLNLQQLFLSENNLSGVIPTELGQLTKLNSFTVQKNQLTGNIPPELGNMTLLRSLTLGENLLSGAIPSELGNLSNLRSLGVYENQLTGNIPNELTNLPDLQSLQFQGNQFSGDIGDFTSLGLATLNIFDNAFLFSNFEFQHAAYETNINSYNYSPQAKVDLEETLSGAENGTITLTSTALTSPNNSYQWFKDGVAIAGATSKDYVITSATSTDAGVYYFEATNSIVTGLTLTRNNITLSIDPPVNTCGVSEIEKQALLDLYNSTDGVNWTNTLASNQPWDTNTPVCDWYGVTVVNGKVTMVQVSNNSLTGTIPNSISDLSYLTNLGLSNNSLTGNIPSSLGDILTLQTLQLNSNDLEGLIPETLGDLSNLKTLWLYANSFTGDIPFQLGNLSNLQSLHLAGNNLTGTLPGEIGNLVELTYLNVGNNNLTGEIPSTFANLSSLISLWLWQNDFSGSVPAVLSNLTNLQQLVLYRNNFSGNLPMSLNNLNSLSYVRIYENNFSGSIPFDINLQPNLSTLDFKYNNYVFNDFENSHPSYVDNINTYTYFPQAKIDIEETLSAPENGSITLTSNDLTSPNNLYTWYHVVNGTPVEVQSGAVKDYTITNATPADAGVYYFEATNSIVTGLTLTRNNITLTIDPPVDTCGVSEAEKQALLDLYNSTNGDNWTNTLAGDQPWDINTPVCDWYGVTVVDDKVTELDLGNNNLSGNIPSSVGQLSNLTNLNLYLNQLSGSIPTEVGQLLNLTYLALNRNQLSGNIPSSIGQLLILETLALNNNQLSGSIPDTIGNLGQLRVFFIYSNQLTGEIPESVGDLANNLDFVRFHNNNLEGKLPSGFTNLEGSNITFSFYNNFYHFEDFEEDHPIHLSRLRQEYTFAPQKKVDQEETLSVAENGTITLTSNDLTSPNNLYTWYHLVNGTPVQVQSGSVKDYIITNATPSDAGVYYFEATNSIVTGLTLTRNNINLSINPPVNTCGVSETEKQALLDLYNSTNGDNWTNTLAGNQPWDINIPVCDWFGVTVVDNRITRLDLPDNELSGILSTDLSSLVNLNVINLQNNQLEGGLPISIVSLNQLQYLYLDNNAFVGNIPLSYGNMIQLLDLFINNNQLNGTIPAILSNLSSLKRLGLNNNLLVGSIPSELGSLINLNQLFLNNNLLSGTIPESLGNLTEVTDLYLGFNQLIGQIPLTFENLESLVGLGVNNNFLNGVVPSGISNLSVLQNLYVMENAFVFSDFEEQHPLYVNQLSQYFFVPQAKVDQEETLSVSENGTITLTSTALTSANNSYQWYKDGVAITDATSKEYVIENASEADAGVYYFEATNSIVTGLTLTRNNISLTIGAPVDTCGVSDDEKQALLDLYNSTDGDNWTNTLAGNQPWDTNIPVCDWFGVTVENETVVSLELPDNGVTGNLSESIGNLLNVNLLDLSNNSINGDLPTEIGSLLDLEVLLLPNNELTGELSPTLGSLSNLTNMDLSGNNLSSEIPISFCNLASVTDLNLSGNQLNGSIPPQLRLMSSLERLNLANNELSGQLPSVLIQLTNLQELAIENNRFRGAIPFTASNSNFTSFTFQENNFIFKNFEASHNNFLVNISNYIFSPQSKTDTVESISVTIGNSITLTTEMSSVYNTYQWYKNGIAISEGVERELVIENAVLDDDDDYYVVALNSIVNGLELTRNTITLNVLESCDVPLEQRQALIALYNATNGSNWDNTQQLQQAWGVNNPNSLVCDWYGVTVVNNNIEQLILPNNGLEGNLLNVFTDLPFLTDIDLSANSLSGNIVSTFSTQNSIVSLKLDNNNFIFDDIEIDFVRYNDAYSPNFIYAPQSMVDTAEIINVEEGETVTLTSNQLLSDNNTYQWFKKGLPILGATSKDLILTNVSSSDNGGYHFEATNNIVTGLTLVRKMVMLKVNSGPDACGVSDLERQTLIAFYEALDGVNWTDNTNWNTDAPVCDWYGVATDIDANVIGISLPNNELRGEIPESISQLVSLEQIDFSQNNVIGQLPVTLGDILSLRSLTLNDNIIVGEIPEELGNLSLLNNLNLANNRISGAIPSTIGGMQNLQYVDLNNNKLNQNIPLGVYSIPTLIRFNVSNNEMTGSISDTIGNLQLLEQFWLANNNFGGEVPVSIATIPTLISVRLNNNNFNGDIPVLLPDFTVPGAEIAIEENGFVFSDFEDEYPDYSTLGSNFTYNPQDDVDNRQTIPVLEGTSITLGTQDLTSPNNSYVWYKDGVVIPGVSGNSYTVTNFDPSVDGGNYWFVATNSTIPVLELTRRTITLVEKILEPILNLTLTPVCFNPSTSTLQWQITNPNLVSINVSWEIEDSSETGSILATSGDTIFSTIIINDNDNATTIFWNDEYGNPRSETKVKNDIICDNSEPILELELITLCSDDPSLTREWQIENLNVVPVQVNWVLQGSAQSETLIVNPGNSTITTQTISGDNILNISWDDELEVTQNKELVSPGEQCPFPADCTDLLVGADGSFQTTSSPSNVGRNGTLDGSSWDVNEGTPDTFSFPLTSGGDKSMLYGFDSSPNSGVCLGAMRVGDTTESFSTQIGGLQVGATYYVEFYQANATNLLDVRFYDETNGFWQVNFGGSSQESVRIPSYAGPSSWSRQRLEFVAGSTNQELRFAVASTMNDQNMSYPVYMLIDGIRVYAKPENLLSVECYDLDVQVFCSIEENNEFTISDLVAPQGTNVIWYSKETGGTRYFASDELLDLTTSVVWADDGSGSRIPLEIIFDLGAPRGNEVQTFDVASNLTLSNMVVEGTNITWHDSFSGNSELPLSTNLVNGETYYAAMNGNACRLGVKVEIDVPLPEGNGFQNFCSTTAPTINDIVMNTTNSAYSILWYSQLEGGTEIDTSQPLVDGGTYYAAQSNGTITGQLRAAVNVSVLNVSAAIKTYEQDVVFPTGSTIANLSAFYGYTSVQWYNQEIGGSPYPESYLMANGETYYARIGAGLCAGTEVLSVSVSIEDEVAPELVTCIKFLPQPFGDYVISGWVREEALTVETAGSIEFEEDITAKGAVLQLFQKITDRLITGTERLEIPSDVFVVKEIFPDLDMSALLPYLKNFTGNQIMVYDFKLEKETVAGLERSVGYSFSFDSDNSSRLEFRTPEIEIQFLQFLGFSQNIYKTGYHFPLLNYDADNLTITHNYVTSLSGDRIRVNSDFVLTLPDDSNYRASYTDYDTDSTNDSGVQGIAPVFNYIENPDYNVLQYDNTSITFLYKNLAGDIIDPNATNTRVLFEPKGPIIDGWQRISGTFTIPSSAAYMRIDLKNQLPGVNAYFDDVRMHPLDSNMKSFVYDPITQRLQAELDENNYATFYEYDTEGGLVRVKKETERGIYTIQETRSGNSKLNSEE